MIPTVGFVPVAASYAPNPPPPPPTPAEEPAGIFCASLPSANTVNDLLDGKLSALPNLARDMIVRSATVALGAYVVGQRDHLVRVGIGGALGIEVGVVALTMWKRYCDGVR